MPTTISAQAAQSRSSITDTGSDLNSIEEVANVSFDNYIKWHTVTSTGYQFRYEFVLCIVLGSEFR